MTDEYHLDTNVLIHLFIQDQGSEIHAVRKLFADAAEGRCTLTLHEAVIAETVWVLKRKFGVTREEISAPLMTVARSPGVRCVAPSRTLTGLRMYAGAGLDIVDCFLAAESAFDGSTVATFDRRIGRVPGVRVHPEG